MTTLENIINKYTDISIAPSYNEIRLIAPFYHEDGDIYELFIKLLTDGSLLIYDNGLTLMRLSYTFSLDTDKQIEILNNILRENRIDNNNGNLSIRTHESNFIMALNQFCTTIAKITNMNILSKEIVSSLFYEYVDDYMTTKFTNYNVIKHYKPTDTEYFPKAYKIETRRPVVLLPVKDSLSAARAAFACNKLQKILSNFTSVSVCEDLDSLSKMEKYNLMDAADKVYPQYNEFQEHFPEYVTRIAS